MRGSGKIERSNSIREESYLLSITNKTSIILNFLEIPVPPWQRGRAGFVYICVPSVIYVRYGYLPLNMYSVEDIACKHQPQVLYSVSRFSRGQQSRESPVKFSEVRYTRLHALSSCLLKS